MGAHSTAVLVLGGAGLGVVVWVLAKLGHALGKIAEAVAAAAVLFMALWLVVKAVVWAVRQVMTHWRTSLAVLAVLVWWHWLGWLSLVVSSARWRCRWPRGGWRIWSASTGGSGGICGRGGCAGRSTRVTCPAGCMPAACRSGMTRCRWW